MNLIHQATLFFTSGDTKLMPFLSVVILTVLFSLIAGVVWTTCYFIADYLKYQQVIKTTGFEDKDVYTASLFNPNNQNQISSMIGGQFAHMLIIAIFLSPFLITAGLLIVPIVIQIKIDPLIINITHFNHVLDMWIAVCGIGLITHLVLKIYNQNEKRRTRLTQVLQLIIGLIMILAMIIVILIILN